MAEFQNTIDLLGDEVVASYIADRSIVNFSDDILNNVGNGAFQQCSALTSVDLPNVTSIGNGAFNRCSALVSVHLPAVPPSIQTTSFSGISAECVFYIPTGSSSAYQAHSNWSSMMTQYSFVEEDR